MDSCEFSVTEAEDGLRFNRNGSQMNAHNKENMRVSRSVRNKYIEEELGLDIDFDREISSSDVRDQTNKRRKPISSGKSKTGKNPQIQKILCFG